MTRQSEPRRAVRAARLALAVPFRVALCLVALGPTPAPAAEAGPLDELRAEALLLVNDARAERGLRKLEPSDRLNAIAQQHAADMLRRDYYAHASPEGKTVRGRFLDAGGSRSRLVAENIAKCSNCPSPPDTMRVLRFQRGWMDSPPHRRNILSPGLARFGFGVIAGEDGKVYAVQTFSGPGTPPAPNPDEVPVPLIPEVQARRALEIVNRVRRREGRDPLAPSAALNGVARKLLPPRGATGRSATLARPGSLYDLLPGKAKGRWHSLAFVGAACGGCGVDPTAADIRDFADRWMNDPRYRETLLDAEASHLGFAMRANGEGRKLAALVVGRRR